MITTTLPNGVQTTPTYDPAGRLTALFHARATTVLARYATWTPPATARASRRRAAASRAGSATPTIRSIA
ncbi:MAG: hypothetical protein JXA33_04630 [Anaerolineae bacterium]|nr:hypothetical protein [Anaerolineae bacterium]